MDLVVDVEAGDRAAELRSLREWLVGEPALRGRVGFVEQAPPPGTLGGVVDVLTVALGQGGPAAALASVLIAWIRRRAGVVTVMLTRPDGTSIKVEGRHVRGLDPAGVEHLVAGVARSLEGTDEQAGGRDG